MVEICVFIQDDMVVFVVELIERNMILVYIFFDIIINIEEEGNIDIQDMFELLEFIELEFMFGFYKVVDLCIVCDDV